MKRPDYMAEALAEARAAAAAGEVPVGAVLVDAASGAVLARAHNRVEAPTAIRRPMPNCWRSARPRPR